MRLPDLPRELHELPLVVRLHRLSAEERDAVRVRKIEKIENFLLRGAVKSPPVAKIPCLRLKTSLTVIRASGHKERHADALTVRYIKLLNLPIIHGILPYLFSMSHTSVYSLPGSDRTDRLPHLRSQFEKSGQNMPGF